MRKTSMTITMLCLGLLLLVSGPLAAQNIDLNHVKSIWNTLTPDEQAAYERMVMADARAKALGSSIRPVLRAPGDSCGAATPEIGALPYMDSGDTTGLADDYNLGAEANPCAGGGSQFSLTGDGPDIAYKMRVDATCDVNVNMDPVASDMSLYVVTDCGDVDDTCLGVDDAGGGGTAEDVAFTASAGTMYWVIVDGFGGSSDAYDLTVTETTATGCELIPVELETFNVFDID